MYLFSRISEVVKTVESGENGTGEEFRKYKRINNREIEKDEKL